MKTNLYRTIATVEDAKAFLKELYDNKELFHPEDDAHDIIWAEMTDEEKPTKEECDRLNELMASCYEVADIEKFDPCGYIIDELKAFDDIRTEEEISMSAKKRAEKLAEKVEFNGSLMWSVNTPGLLQEIVSNPGVSILAMPLSIMGQLLHKLATRAAELNDPELNRYVASMSLYAISDPASPQFDMDKSQQLIYSKIPTNREVVSLEKLSNYLVASKVYGTGVDTKVLIWDEELDGSYPPEDRKHVVLCYWIARREWVVWDSYGEEYNFNHGRYCDSPLDAVEQFHHRVAHHRKYQRDPLPKKEQKAFCERYNYKYPYTVKD